MTAGTVLVFLKYPEPGRVKTRLAATVGDDRAAELYRDWLTQVLTTLQPLRPDIAIVGAIDGAPAEQFADWRPLVDRWWQQPAGDLGTRLDAAFREAHETGAPVVAVGTDCLELDAQLVRDAFAILTSHDAVFGPATDGGYYLVGSSRYLDGFFDGVRWSSPETLSDHTRRCENRGFSHDFLATLPDIDTWDDWLAYCRRAGRIP
ncbi:MAG TPA: TIGR04282 family arsenosugar biosynthesis glycosyltransferase [Gemmata sp.]|nr:TIGR04282 family arsenosugar biosynthesis glycosyltransferase [Gemmata sp.]